MKANCSRIYFIDVRHATLDWTEGWSKRWMVTNENHPHKQSHQQVVGGFMFWEMDFGVVDT